MERLHDTVLFPLPHPVRFDATLGNEADTRLFERFGVMKGLRPYLTDHATTTAWILNHVPGMNELARAHWGLPGEVNLGTFILTLTRARLRAHGDPILQITPSLQAMLAETDLGSGLPVRFFRSSYPLVFIEFAHPNPLRVPNRLSGLHECEGAYVGMYDLPPHHDVHSPRRLAPSLGLDPAKPTRAVEIVIVGSPVGKDNVLDDASQNMLLLSQDEDECLSTLLDRHLPLFESETAPLFPGLPGFAAEEVALVKPVVLELAKILLYLGLPEAETLPVPERETLARRLRGTGQIRTARSKRRLASVYNRTLIGPAALPPAELPAEPVTAESHRSLRPHWRRGHFRRIRFGEGLTESRLGWIQPVLVKAAEVFGTPKSADSPGRVKPRG